MAADLHIHIKEGIDEEDMKHFFSNTLGSKYFNSRAHGEVRQGDAEYLATHPLGAEEKEWRTRLAARFRSEGKEKDAVRVERVGVREVAYSRMQATPNIHVGEVSWLKAALFEDSDTYVPSPVMKVSEAIGEEAVIDEALIAKIEVAFQAENTTGYTVSGAEPIVAFLREHLGKTAFTISW